MKPTHSIRSSRLWTSAAAGWLLAALLPAPAQGSDPAEVAACLSRQGTVLYEASWCGQCDRQRALFGRAAWRLDTVMCNEPGEREMTAQCRAEGITGYPTWAFGDGSRHAGVLSLAALAKAAGCSS